MKFLLFLVALTTWASASIIPTDNNVIMFEFDKIAQTPEDLIRQSKLIEMIMPELSKVLPKIMKKRQPLMQQQQPVQQRPVEYYYMEPTTNLMPPPVMQKKSLEQMQDQIMMESLPMVLQMIAEEHSTPQQDMSMPLPPSFPRKHIPAPPKPFLEPPHFYMKQYEEPAPHHQMLQHQMPQQPMHQQMIMGHPLMYNKPQMQHQFQPYAYQFVENQWPSPPPMFRYQPIYEIHPPMIQHPNFWYNQMHQPQHQPMMGREMYYW